MICPDCKHCGAKLWMSRAGDYDEMLPYCNLHKRYADRVCDDYEEQPSSNQIQQ